MSPATDPTRAPLPAPPSRGGRVAAAIVVGALAVAAGAAAIAYAAGAFDRGSDEITSEKRPRRHSKSESKSDEEKQPVDDAAATIAVPIASTDPVRGGAHALVTIVMYSDFQCPFCARVEPTIEGLSAKYGDDVRVVWKDMPLAFHKNARPAAIAARVVQLAKGNAAFWKMHDTLFKNQSSLDDASFKTWAAELDVGGRDFERLEARATELVKGGETEAPKVGVNGTPGFLIDGEYVSGAQPTEKFEEIIDAHLAFAKKLRADGTSRSRLYGAMVAHYFKEPSARAAPTSTTPTIDTTVWKVPVGASPYRGDRDALVTIVTFGDYQCPFCKRLEVTLAKLRTDYPASKVRFVWKDLPLSFHPRALPAAMLALEARKELGDVGFWKAHDELYDLQPALDDAALDGAASVLGLDAAKTKGAISSTKYRWIVDGDTKLAADVGATGTPSSFVNGRLVTGAQPYDVFQKVIDEEIPKAEAKLRAGTARADLYDEIIHDGRGGVSGLVKVDIVVGTGAEPRAGDTIRVHYVGTLASGAKFDSSRDRGRPFECTFGTGAVIKGWDLGIAGMKVGGKRTLTIPSGLAYGDKGFPPAIPAKATLTFEVELLAVTPAK